MLTLDGRWRTPPDEIEWAVPFFVSSCVADGQRLPAGKNGVVIPPGTREVRVGGDD